jgi:hypothetical protein
MIRLRFGAIVLAYKQEDYISYCLRELSAHVDYIVVLFSERPWIAYNRNARGDFTLPDNTRELLAALQCELPNLAVVEGVWDSEEEMRNEGLQVLRRVGMQVCLMVDADEFYPEHGLQDLRVEIERVNAPGTVYFARYLACFRRFDYVVETRYQRLNGDGEAPHRAPVAVHLNAQTAFRRHRQPLQQERDLPESIFFWHMGYVLSDRRMWEKLNTFGHAQELVPGWFEEKWLRWTPQTQDLFFKTPPSRWPRTIKIDPRRLPKILHAHPYFPTDGGP